MIIGIDLDHTLVKNNGVEVASKELGYNYTTKDITDYYYNCFPKILKERAFELYRDNDFMSSFSPFDGAAEKIQEWSNAGHKVILITARDYPVHKGTVELINKYFSSINQIIFVDLHKSKMSKFREVKPDVWIDDSPFDVETSCELGIKTYLISNEDTPYNHHIINKLPVIVVRSVAEIDLCL